MARPRNTDVDRPEPVMAAEATVEPPALLAEVVVPAPAAAKEPPTPAERTPQQPLVPPPEAPAQPPAVAAAATKPGLRQIGKGNQIRQVHPVDVADWLALGWQVLPADQLPG
jgi:hypothetical protein